MTQANVGGNTISNGKTVKLLWITVDNKLSFESDLNKNAKKKIYIYICIYPKTPCSCKNFNFHFTKKLRMIMRVLITSQFSYCTLVWVCESRTVKEKSINFMKGL